MAKRAHRSVSSGRVFLEAFLILELLFAAFIFGARLGPVPLNRNEVLWGGALVLLAASAWTLWISKLRRPREPRASGAKSSGLRP